MARNRKKKALYEVISKARFKSSYGKALERLQSGKAAEDEPIAARAGMEIAERAAGWPRRPKMAQFNAGRIEISMPYQLAIALLLGLVLLILVAFRLGQINQKAADSAIKMQEPPQEAVGRPIATAPQMPAPVEKPASVAASAEKVEPATPKGNNRIVIQTWQSRAQLEPVKDFFARVGIETEIRKIDNWWYLITKDKYENPERQGTDGYSAKQKIIELGAKYKAPPGRETFGPKPFDDAYGMKFDN